MSPAATASTEEIDVDSPLIVGFGVTGRAWLRCWSKTVTALSLSTTHKEPRRPTERAEELGLDLVVAPTKRLSNRLVRRW